MFARFLFWKEGIFGKLELLLIMIEKIMRGVDFEEIIKWKYGVSGWIYEFGV